MASRGAKDRPKLVCRNVVVRGHRTSLRMEPLLWEALGEIAQREDMTLNQLCTMVDRRRGTASLTASIRVHIVNYFRNAARRRPPGLAEEAEDGRDSPLLARALRDAIPIDDE